MIHPLDGLGRPRAGPVLHPVGQLGLAAEASSAVLPSTPAVSRPALISVTRRTLNSVFARERSINFCRLRTRLRSPARDAVKIRCRRRRTSSSTVPPIDRRPVEMFVLRSVHHASVRPHRRRATVCSSWRPTCPSVPASCIIGPHRLTRPTSAPFRVRAPARIRPVIRDDRRRSRSRRPGFPLPFGHRHSLLGSSCSRWGVRPSSRSAYRTRIDAVRTPTGLSRSARARHDRGGCPLYPGTAVSSRPVSTPRPAPAASQRPALTPRCNNPSAEARSDEASQGFTHVHPSGLPLTCSPRMEREPLGLNPELRTPPLPATHVRAGTGHRTLTRDYAYGISRTSSAAH